MRIIPFRIPKTSPEAFRIQTEELPRLYDHLHQHPEIQITSIVSSEGTLLAGDYIGRFKPGDVFFIGTNLPHVFRNDKEYGTSELKAQTISLYFDETMLGAPFWNLPETRGLLSFLRQPQQAFQIFGEKAIQVQSRLTELMLLKGIHRLTAFLSMLSCFENEEDMIVLSGRKNKNHLKPYDGDRINRVLEFTFSAFHRPVALEEVAAIANLSTIAFCRYFKTRTGKTYFSFLSELRIQQAQKLLADSAASVVEVAYQSGFNNLSHFNRMFRKVAGTTPSAFRNLPESR